MAIKKSKKPKMWTKEEFHVADRVMDLQEATQAFESRHGVSLSSYFSEVPYKDGDEYGIYVEWFNKKFTKLGRVLG